MIFLAKHFWNKQTADTEGMCLNEDASEFDDIEKLEICGYFPELKDKIILELGAGIGRFTGFFASSAKKVVAVDFVEKFIEKNKELNSSYSNIRFITQNVMKLNFRDEKFDFIFMNWLLMYLSESETRFLTERIKKWLKPNGCIFLRESCNRASNPTKPMPNTHYRSPNYYEKLFYKLDILNYGNIKVYERKFGNPDQCWWIFKLK